MYSARQVNERVQFFGAHLSCQSPVTMLVELELFLE